MRYSIWAASNLPEHRENLACPLRVWTAVIAKQLVGNFLERPLSISMEQLSHLDLVVGIGARRGFGRPGQSVKRVAVVVNIPIQHLAIVGEARVSGERVG
jgi:hypothetical protein